MSKPKDPNAPPPAPGRRRLLTAGLGAGVAAALPPAAGEAAPRHAAGVKPFELDEAGIAELQKGMASGRFTARSLVKNYLERIAEIDRGGPRLRSVIEVNPDAPAIAADLDRERRAKGPRGPLHGIPVLVKDNIDTADRMATTAGSLALVGTKPSADSFVVRQLRRAGAVILGKTNLSEWANIRSDHSTSGWSARGGLTRNPYALDRNPSGSSSGSGAAAAASLCAAAVGTETDGSIVSPSSANGVVGIKPTVGLVSRTGIIPISHTQDTAGPIARTVRDAAALLGALAGADPEDPATVESLGKGEDDYTRFLDPRGLKDARLGFLRKFSGIHRAVDALMEDAVAAMKREGATIVEISGAPALGEFGDGELTVLMYELKADLNAYLARRAPPASRRGPETPLTLKDLIEFNDRNAKEELRYFGQDRFLVAETKGPLTNKEYLDALEKNRRLARTDGIDAVMEKHRLDALVAPTSGPAWVTDLIDGDHFVLESSSLAAVAGYPNVTVPAGFVFGLPVGISFLGRAWSEPVLLRIAYAFEQATLHRRPPRFLRTADLGG